MIAKEKYSFYIDSDMLSILKVISDDTGKSVSWLINNIVNQWILGYINGDK